MTDDVLTLVRMANTVPDLADLDSEEVRNSQAAIDDALRIERTPGLALTRPPRSRLRPILVAAMVAVVVALAVGIPALLSRSSDEAPVVDEPAPTTVVTTASPPTTSVTTTAGPSTTTQPPQTPAAPPPTTLQPVTEPPDVFGLTMRLATDPGEFGEASVAAVAGSESGFVGVGWEGGDGAAWTSTDGANWSRASDDAALAGNDIQEIYSVVAGGPGFVAVGRNGSTAGVWSSPDGETWTLVTDEVFGSLQQPATAFDVAANRGGLVIVGSGGDQSPDRWGLDYGSDIPVVWFSQDGSAWERLSIETFGDAQPFFFESVESSDSRFYLESTHDDTLQQWSSQDGYEWTQTSWPLCGTADPDANLFEPYPGAECVEIGNLEVPTGAEADPNHMVRIGSQLIVTGSIQDNGIEWAAIWITDLDY